MGGGERVARMLAPDSLDNALKLIERIKLDHYEGTYAPDRQEPLFRTMSDLIDALQVVVACLAIQSREAQSTRSLIARLEGSFRATVTRMEGRTHGPNR